MQVVLGSAGSKASLDEILSQSPLDEIEIVDADGNALAYVVPAARPGDATYAKFEAIFQSHADVLNRRAANSSPEVSTREMLANLEREELLQLLRELCAECPDVRFGQLVANMSVVARGAEPNAVWDMEDDELLGAVRSQLELFRARRAQRSLMSNN